MWRYRKGSLKKAIQSEEKMLEVYSLVNEGLYFMWCKWLKFCEQVWVVLCWMCMQNLNVCIHYILYTYITHIFWLGKILEKIGLSVGLFICQGLDCLCGLEGLEGMEGMEVFHPAMISVHVSENIFIFSTVSQNA